MSDFETSREKSPATEASERDIETQHAPEEIKTLAGNNNPNPSNSVQRLATTPGTKNRQQTFREIQHTYGNKVAANIAQRYSRRTAAVIQRHPENAPPSVDPVEAGKVLAAPTPTDKPAAPAPAGGAPPKITDAASTEASETPASTTEASSTTPSTPASATETGSAPAGPATPVSTGSAPVTTPTTTEAPATSTGPAATETTTPATGAAPATAPTTGTEPATTSGTTAPTGTTTPASGGATPTATGGPAPVSPQAVNLAAAQSILQNSYGTIRTIVPGTVVTLADNAATLARYDQLNIGRNNIYVTPNRPWRTGDAALAFPGGLDGFADNGVIYANQSGTQVMLTVAHEMLHNNTASGFRAAVGETINEGATELMAANALTAQSVPLGGGLAYADQVGVVRRLIALVGMDTLTTAYFNGAPSLVTAYENIMGARQFRNLKRAAEALDQTALGPLLTAPAPTSGSSAAPSATPSGSSAPATTPPAGP